jgi:hypothetical protein
MAAPSSDDPEKRYPLADWGSDMDFWFSKGALSTADFPQVEAYFRRVQSGNQNRDDNCSRMWMALAFLQSFLPDLIRGGAALVGSSGETLLPPALVSALYRAFMSPVAASNPRGITVPLILQVVKEQRDWNEDRG